jgi:hypothetical protein
MEKSSASQQPASYSDHDLTIKENQNREKAMIVDKKHPVA